MTPPTPASLKKVSPENLAELGTERLAQILTDAGRLIWGGESLNGAG